MQPIPFEEATHILGAGNNPNTGDMPVVTAIDPQNEGYGLVISCWEPTVEELAELIKNKKVYIGVMCNVTTPTQPPVSLMAFNPFVHHGFLALQKRLPGERMFIGKVNVNHLSFETDALPCNIPEGAKPPMRKFSLTIHQGPNTFLLKNVIEVNEEGEEVEEFDRTSHPYFKAWEILSQHYKEI
jgi:hypothetical protein